MTMLPDGPVSSAGQQSALPGMCQRAPLERVLHRVLVEADHLARVEVAPEAGEDGGAVTVAALDVPHHDEGPGAGLKGVSAAGLGGRGHVADDLPPE